MPSPHLALFSAFPFVEERKIFRRRAILRTEDRCAADARTVDISGHDLNLIVDRPLKVGESADLHFNITVDQKTVLLGFSGHIACCILAGMEGYRVRFEIDQGYDQSGCNRLQGLMERLS